MVTNVHPCVARVPACTESANVFKKNQVNNMIEALNSRHIDLRHQKLYFSYIISILGIIYARALSRNHVLGFSHLTVGLQDIIVAA
jgi:hypothetical protein